MLLDDAVVGLWSTFVLNDLCDYSRRRVAFHDRRLRSAAEPRAYTSRPTRGDGGGGGGGGGGARSHRPQDVVQNDRQP